MIHVVHISKVLTSLQAKVKVTEATQHLFCLVQLVVLVEKKMKLYCSFFNGTLQKFYLNVFACLKYYKVGNFISTYLLYTKVWCQKSFLNSATFKQPVILSQ